MRIEIKQGLDIPILGGAKGDIEERLNIEEVALDLRLFSQLRFKLLVKEGDLVVVGQPLASDKKYPERLFVSPANGTIQRMIRGDKRKLLAIVISLSPHGEQTALPPFDLRTAQREALLSHLQSIGLFVHFRQRPFDQLASPTVTPRAIFVRAMESAPFRPSQEMQLQGLEEPFAIGLEALKKLTSGEVHLVYSADSDFHPFLKAKGVIQHTAKGPHPIAHSSLHIERIDPIRGVDDIVWTISARETALIGYALQERKLYLEKIVALAGEALDPKERIFIKTREGSRLADLFAGRLAEGNYRLISGDPLTGRSSSFDDYLGFNDTVVCAIPRSTKREFLHFFRLGREKFSHSPTYLSSFLQRGKKLFSFTTSNHGERRHFITNTPYDRVMPLNISTVPLVKAVMASDFESAIELGFLDVSDEDFALSTFVCPSKIEIGEIIRNGLDHYAKEVLP